MNPAAALRAYAQVALTTRTPRELEAEAFAKANRLLKGAQRALQDYEQYAESLRFNRSLWTIIQVDVGSDTCPLPPELRTSVFQLSLFVDRRTLLALGDPNGEHLQVLIDVNQQLMEGLLEKQSLK